MDELWQVCSGLEESRGERLLGTRINSTLILFTHLTSGERSAPTINLAVCRSVPVSPSRSESSPSDLMNAGAPALLVLKRRESQE